MTDIAAICAIYAGLILLAIVAWWSWKHRPDWFITWLETRDERAIAMRTADEARARRDMEEALAMANAEVDWRRTTNL